ncbi:MAG: pilus assembly protein TadG-related protein [Bacillota bacterium]|jgi:hypothetical protein
MKRRAGLRLGLGSLSASEDGSVVAVVAVFLHVAILSVTVVLGLHMVYFAKKALQAACDFGVLAGVIELD